MAEMNDQYRQGGSYKRANIATPGVKAVELTQGPRGGTLGPRGGHLSQDMSEHDRKAMLLKILPATETCDLLESNGLG